MPSRPPAAENVYEKRRRKHEEALAKAQQRSEQEQKALDAQDAVTRARLLRERLRVVDRRARRRAGW